MIIDSQKLVFVHIMKTGSTSVSKLLENKYNVLDLSSHGIDRHITANDLLLKYPKCKNIIP